MSVQNRTDLDDVAGLSVRVPLSRQNSYLAASLRFPQCKVAILRDALARTCDPAPTELCPLLLRPLLLLFPLASTGLVMPRIFRMNHILCGVLLIRRYFTAIQRCGGEGRNRTHHPAQSVGSA